MPSEIENINGMPMANTIAGKNSVMSDQSTSLSDLIIKEETNRSAAEVAKLGMLLTSGLNARQTITSSPAVTADNPVLPPLSPPAAASYFNYSETLEFYNLALYVSVLCL